jgi:hypothetical protein
MSVSSSSLTNSLAELDEFYQTKLKQKLLELFKHEPACLQKVANRFEQMIDYNVPHGKKLRGLCAYESLLCLIDHQNSSAVNFDRERLIEQAKAMGWCIEFVCVQEKLIEF